MTIRKLLGILAVALLALLGLGLTPEPASAQTPGLSEPFPGNPHWFRYTGYEAVVQFHVDASAKGMHPLLVDAAASWNQNSPYTHMQVLPLGGDCRGQTTFCVTVAEANNYACGQGNTFYNYTTTSYGHRHFTPALIAMNALDCGLTLLQMKYLMCHEAGHAWGVNHDDATSIRPCSPGDGLPVENDRNVRNFLHVSG